MAELSLLFQRKRIIRKANLQASSRVLKYSAIILPNTAVFSESLVKSVRFIVSLATHYTGDAQ